MPPSSRGLVPRPVVQTSPVLARYLDDLAQQARLAAAAADARRMDIHFGRVQPEDPFAGIGGDEIADMVGATAAPRRWLEADAYNKSIEGLMPSGPGEPLLDALARNDRTRALVQGRLDRLAPEQMPGSLGLVGRRYDADQAAARAADILADRNLGTAAALGIGGALGAGAFGARMALENQQNQQDQMLLGAWENQAAEVARREQAKARADRSLMASVDRSISEIDFSDDAPVVIVPDIPGPDEVRNSFLETPFLSRTPEGNFRPSEDPFFRGKNTFFASDFRTPSPDDAVAFAPGPEAQVSRVPELEELPGPQLRSIRALMRGGIPEGRARDIILKGSSMSPDEYRMVTGGRR